MVLDADMMEHTQVPDVLTPFSFSCVVVSVLSDAHRWGRRARFLFLLTMLSEVRQGRGRGDGVVDCVVHDKFLRIDL